MLVSNEAGAFAQNSRICRTCCKTYVLGELCNEVPQGIMWYFCSGMDCIPWANPNIDGTAILGKLFLPSSLQGIDGRVID